MVDYLLEGSRKTYLDLKKKLDNGEIKNETEFFYHLKNELLYLYKTSKFSPFVFEEDRGLPLSSKYDGDNEDIYNSLKFILEITKYYDEKLNRAGSENDMFSKYTSDSIRLITKQIVELEDSIKNFASESVNSFTDSFISSEFRGSVVDDTTSVNEEALSIISTSGVLTLPIQKTNKSTGTKLAIIDTNGVCGNSHEISKNAFGTHFIGESNLSADIEMVLENTQSEWFECEMFNIDDEIYEQCNGQGFEYKEGISWVSEDDSLYLKLRVSVRGKEKLSWIELDPYVIEKEGFVSPVINSIVISDGNSSIQTITYNKPFSKGIVLNFEEQYVSYIDILITTTRPYLTEVGHIYSVRHRSDVESVFGNPETTSMNRIDLYKPSIKDLYMSYDPKTKKVSSSTDRNSIGGSIFEVPNSTANVKSGIEIIKASRYAIGISALRIGYYNFKHNGVYISTPFRSTKNIKSLVLNADDFMPTTKCKIIYSVSLDNGDNWIKLTPRGRVNNNPCAIEINSDLPFGERTKNTIYIDRLMDTKEVMVKIEMSSGIPETDDELNITSLSPLVYSYRIDIETAGGEYDY